MEQIIIFAATKRSTEKLAKQMQEAGHKASFLEAAAERKKLNATRLEGDQATTAAVLVVLVLLSAYVAWMIVHS